MKSVTRELAVKRRHLMTLSRHSFMLFIKERADFQGTFCIIHVLVMLLVGLWYAIKEAFSRSKTEPPSLRINMPCPILNKVSTANFKQFSFDLFRQTRQYYPFIWLRVSPLLVSQFRVRSLHAVCDAAEPVQSSSITESVGDFSKLIIFLTLLY